MDKIERTLLVAKPDAFFGRHVGDIVSSIEELDELSIVGLKLMEWNIPLASEFYSEHEGRDYYEGLVEFMTVGPVVAMVIEGIDVIATVRKLSGSTNPANADPGTFRRRFGTPFAGPQNATHSSDSAESAEREINLLFNADELIGWDS